MKLFQLSWHSSDETEIVWQLSPHCFCVRFLNENQKQGCKIQRLFYIFGIIGPYNWGTVSPQGQKGTQQEVVMKLCLKSSRTSASTPPLKTQLQESWSSSPSVNRKVMPTQHCIEGQSLCKKTEIPLWYEVMTSAKLCRHALQKRCPRSTYIAAKIWSPLEFQLS